MPTCGAPSQESDRLHPVSPYAVTELAGEQLCLAHAARSSCPTSVVALRYFTVYGPRQRPGMFLHRVLRAALTGEPLRGRKVRVQSDCPRDGDVPLTRANTHRARSLLGRTPATGLRDGMRAQLQALTPAGHGGRPSEAAAARSHESGRSHEPGGRAEGASLCP
ncbi:NAD-dependent epimerase/dehydratase family protein [Streptomyces sp. NPDC052101]|uniref:NAD-dependent epimerase/dehydratase family protein n=1 Tax=Streptomyces sp. NPDC052101 TaxID=3155763 RepID=UPI003419249C